MQFLKKIYKFYDVILIFLLLFFINLYCSNISGDEIWNYGFSINIINGLVPYRDFNMVVTPFYPMLMAFFLGLLGKNMFAYHLINALICTGIYALLKKIFPKVYPIPFCLMMGIAFIYCFLFPSYNTLIFFFLLIVLYLEKLNDSKYDIIIGIVVGLIIMTKQNIGLLIFMASMTIMDLKRIIKRLLGASIPIILVMIYLILNKAFLDFINYTILGLNDFKKNLLLEKTIIFFVFTVIYCLYQILIRRNKDIFLRYILCFCVMCYPIFDYIHVMPSFCLILAYILEKYNYKTNVLEGFLFGYLLISIIISLINNNIVLVSEGYLKYRGMNSNIYHYANELSMKLLEYNDSYDRLYLFMDNAYFFKLYNGLTINKFDLINDGNMGYKGDIKYIAEIENTCQDLKCVFIVSRELDNQINKNIIMYVKDNYMYKDDIYSYFVYDNIN